MQTITYSPIGGYTCTDGELDSAARLILTHKQDITVSNTLLIDAIRLQIKKGFVPNLDVVFHFNHHRIYIDQNGNLDHYPVGFGDILETILMELAGWGDPVKTNLPP